VRPVPFYDAPVEISIRVPYDDASLRRTLKFVLRPYIRRTRAAGGLLIVGGLSLALLRPMDSLSYFVVLLGLWWAVGVGPISLNRSMRTQSSALKEECHMLLDDEWITVTQPRLESRFRWSAFERVVETEEAWYALLGKRQALEIPKEPMTADERAEFAAFVSRLQPTGDRPRTGATRPDAGHHRDPVVRPPTPPMA
jgi:YcxB-like protein